VILLAHIGKNLAIPAFERLSHVRPTDEDERRAITRRLMHDEDIAIEDRFAGLLVLLLVSHLPITAVIIKGPQTSLLLGITHLLLPDPLKQTLPKAPRSATRTHDDRHLVRLALALPRRLRRPAPQQLPPLGTRHKRLGIYSRPGRTSALMGLSTQLPAAVLTELLGLSPETATAWTQTGGNWARYAAELHDRPRPRIH
jgi:hypothetical protein